MRPRTGNWGDEYKQPPPIQRAEKLYAGARDILNSESNCRAMVEMTIVMQRSGIAPWKPRERFILSQFWNGSQRSPTSRADKIRICDALAPPPFFA